jgi:hypothetical protein
VECEAKHHFGLATELLQLPISSLLGMVAVELSLNFFAMLRNGVIQRHVNDVEVESDRLVAAAKSTCHALCAVGAQAAWR